MPKYKYEVLIDRYKPISGCANCPLAILKEINLGWDYPYDIRCEIMGENIGFRASETSERPHFCPLEEVK